MNLSLENKKRFKKLLFDFEPFNKRSFEKKGTIYTENLSFRNDFGFDSLDEVEFLMKIEKEFNVGISDEQAQNIKTIKDAHNVLGKVIK